MIFGTLGVAGLVEKIKAATIAFREMAAAERLAAVGAKGLSIALKAVAETALFIVIGLAIQGLAKFADKLIVTKSELSEFRSEVASTAESLRDSYEQFTEESRSIGELISQYKEIAQSAGGLTEKKDELLEIQTSLIDKYGEEAEGLDLVNGKYDETIQKIEELSAARRTEWERENADKIAQAQKIAEYDVGWVTKNANGFYEESGEHSQFFSKGTIENSDKLAASLYKIKGVSEDLEKVYKKIDGIDFIDGITSNDLLLSGTVEEARDQLGELIDKYKELAKVGQVNSDGLKELSAHYETLNRVLADTDSFLGARASENIDGAILDREGEISTESLDLLSNLSAGLQEARAKWFENLKAMEGDVETTVNAMVSALQTMAKGEGLAGEDFWNIMSFDTNKTLSDIKMVGDKFVINEQQLVRLKDDYIRKQIESLKNDNQTLETKKQELKATIEQAKVELQMLGRRGGADAAYRKELEAARNAVNDAEKGLVACDEQIRLNTIRSAQWQSKLGNCRDLSAEIADLQEKVAEAQKAADDYSKAMTTAVQNVIDGLDKEKQTLEDQKAVLNEHLDILNEKKETIEDTIEQYKSIVDVVKDISDAEIDALEARQEAEEEALQSRIDAIKTEKEEKEEAASLDEKQLDLRKKLAELDKAKSTKVRTYSAERGWHFDVDAEAVSAAQSAANDAQKAYDTAVSNKKYDDEVKALEAQKKAVSENYKAQIKLQQDYYDQWSEIATAQEKAENEQLAQQILGADYREKIKNKDTGLLKKFESDFKSYNSQLDRLVNGEIASLQTSIKAKDKEIDAKNKQIDAWKRYKSEVETAITNVSNKYGNYLNLLNEVTLTESSSYEDRENALRDFVQKFDDMTSLIEQYQGRVKALQFKAEFNDWEAREKMAKLVGDYAWAIERMEHRLVESLTGYGIVNSPGDVAILEEAKRKILGYAQGGVIDYTGVANVHGSKSSSEIAFNATQARELYDMVRSGSFAAQVADKAYMGLRTAMTKMNTTTNNSTNSNITIQQMTIKANNPMEFHSQFMQEMGKYWNVKLTESRVK